MNGLFARMAARAMGLPPAEAGLVPARAISRRDPDAGGVPDDPFVVAEQGSEGPRSDAPTPREPARTAPRPEPRPLSPRVGTATTPTTNSTVATGSQGLRSERNAGDAAGETSTAADARRRQLTAPPAAPADRPRVSDAEGSAVVDPSPATPSRMPREPSPAAVPASRAVVADFVSLAANPPIMAAQATDAAQASFPGPRPRTGSTELEPRNMRPEIVRPRREAEPDAATARPQPRPLEPLSREQAAPAVAPKPRLVIEELRVEVVPPSPSRPAAVPPPAPQRPRGRSVPMTTSRPARRTFGLGQM